MIIEFLRRREIYTLFSTCIPLSIVSKYHTLVVPGSTAIAEDPASANDFLDSSESENDDDDDGEVRMHRKLSTQRAEVPCYHHTATLRVLTHISAI